MFTFLKWVFQKKNPPCLQTCDAVQFGKDYWHRPKNNCQCYRIYQFSDHNECSTTSHGCQQKCVNDHGSYTCSCFNGYQLISDNKTCSGKIQLLSLSNFRWLWCLTILVKFDLNKIRLCYSRNKLSPEIGGIWIQLNTKKKLLQEV